METRVTIDTCRLVNIDLTHDKSSSPNIRKYPSPDMDISPFQDYVTKDPERFLVGMAANNAVSNDRMVMVTTQIQVVHHIRLGSS